MPDHPALQGALLLVSTGSGLKLIYQRVRHLVDFPCHPGLLGTDVSNKTVDISDDLHFASRLSGAFPGLDPVLNNVLYPVQDFTPRAAAHKCESAFRPLLLEHNPGPALAGRGEDRIQVACFGLFLGSKLHPVSEHINALAVAIPIVADGELPVDNQTRDLGAAIFVLPRAPGNRDADYFFVRIDCSTLSVMRILGNGSATIVRATSERASGWSSRVDPAVRPGQANGGLESLDRGHCLRAALAVHIQACLTLAVQGLLDRLYIGRSFLPPCPTDGRAD